jgi:hypothetical protein
MLLMNQMKQICGALFLSAALSACGGGGGGGSAPPSGGGGTTPPPPTTVTKNFTVTVSEIDVSQTSTGESVVVDASDVSASGTVEVTQ